MQSMTMTELRISSAGTPGKADQGADAVSPTGFGQFPFGLPQLLRVGRRMALASYPVTAHSGKAATCTPAAAHSARTSCIRRHYVQ